MMFKTSNSRTPSHIGVIKYTLSKTHTGVYFTKTGSTETKSYHVPAMTANSMIGKDLVSASTTI